MSRDETHPTDSSGLSGSHDQVQRRVSVDEPPVCAEAHQPHAEPKVVEAVVDGCRPQQGSCEHRCGTAHSLVVEDLHDVLNGEGTQAWRGDRREGSCRKQRVLQCEEGRARCVGERAHQR
jgi:hypothetical protein